MAWTGHDACEVEVPTTGFGTKVVKTTIERSGGEIECDWRSGGLRPDFAAAETAARPMEPLSRNPTSAVRLKFAEDVMADPGKIGVRRAEGTGWSLAAALGLMAVAFLWDRIVPPDRFARPEKDEAFPKNRETDRHASPAEMATEGKDRGRHASSPAQIPARGWKDILWRVYGNIGEHRILALAAGMTYYSLLAIFPAIAALVAIYGLFADPASIAKHLDEVAGIIPGGAVDVAREQLTRVATKGDRTLGFTFAIGLAISLWSANAAMKSLLDTLNIVYGEQEKRGFFKLNAMSLGFTVGGIAFVLAALGGVVVIPVVLQ